MIHLLSSSVALFMKGKVFPNFQGYCVKKYFTPEPGCGVLCDNICTKDL